MASALCASLLASSLAIAVFPFAPQQSQGKLEVTILDVGQGDSLFVVSPGGKTLLIDGGGSFGGRTNDSLVLRLRYGNRTVLLAGDAEKQAEKDMLAENSAEVMRADILKVGHHGSKNSTTLEFLTAVHPSVGVISAGKDNPYGHPNQELLERLEQAGVRILRTDRNGAVHVLTDGKRLEITCYVACPETMHESASRQAQTPNQEQKDKQ